MRDILPEDAESTVLNMMNLASHTFEVQAAIPNSSCAFQARFLKNVVQQYTLKKETLQMQNAQLTQTPQTHMSHPQTMASQRLPPEFVGYQENNPFGFSQWASTLSAGFKTSDEKYVMNNPEADPQNYGPSDIVRLTDNDFWDSLFANSGFTVENGHNIPTVME
jgi:hypothetical protein